MTLEELSNTDLLLLFRNSIVSAITQADYDYILEIQEEIHSRMEVEGA
jgi:hypothetical protein